MVVKTNGIEAMRVTTTSHILLGTTNDNGLFYVGGRIQDPAVSSIIR